MSTSDDRERSNRVSASESALFRRQVGEVRGIASDRAVTRRPPPAPRAAVTRADERAVMDSLLTGEQDPPGSGSGEDQLFARPGVQERVLRKLQRGRYRVDAELDLHGLSRAEAQRELSDFLRECLARGARCVRIVHGKGLRSEPPGPVLKPSVALWLQRREDVLAYAAAQPGDGGSGATYVLLRRG